FRLPAFKHSWNGKPGGATNLLGCPAPNQCPTSLVGHDVIAPVLLPAGVVLCCAEGPFFPGVDARRIYATVLSVILQGLGAALTQSDVVFLRPTVVAMSFNQNHDRRMLRQERRISRSRGLFIRPDIRLVKVEKDILHVLRKQVHLAGWRL